MTTATDAIPAALLIRHTGIVVHDMERMLGFYRDLLGMKPWADFRDESAYAAAVTRLPGARIWMVKLAAAQGGSIELLQYESHPQPAAPPRRSCDHGINHVAIQVADIDAVWETLRAAGIEFHAPPTVSPDGGAKVTYCRDPEGGIVELVEILERAPQP